MTSPNVPELVLNPEQYVDQMSQILGLPIPQDCRPGVVDNIIRTAAIAQLVLEFPLPMDIEAAPIFQP